MTQRISYLDGHRGLAILMVLFYHAYARWPELLPYSDRYKLFFASGILGVQLFFLLSGFVILMTLETCPRPREFIRKRWLRLFPGMLICSVVLFATASLFPERPAGMPDVLSLLPGVLFIEPEWIGALINQPVAPLEGAFWSLYVEFKFYIMAAVLYFSYGRARLVFALIVLSIAGILCQWLAEISMHPVAQTLKVIADGLSLRHFGWFAAGAAAYIYTRAQDRRWLAIAGLCAAYSAIAFQFGYWKITAAALAISSFFILSICSPMVRRLLDNRVLLFFGFISYPLYLSHENVMVASIIQLGDSGIMQGAAFLYPCVPVAGLILFSYWCARQGEPLLKKWLAAALSVRSRSAPSTS